MLFDKKISELKIREIMTVFIGIEGGATKSSGVLVDGKTGEIVKEITGGPANVWVGFQLEKRVPV